MVISSNEYFQKDLVNNNIYFFNGISNEEKLSEYFRFCFKKGSWVIYKEITLKSDYIIEQATLEMNRIFKGGNLKENIFEVINENGEFIDDENQNKFIFIFKDLKTNKKIIRLFLIAENTTSDYQFIEKKELLTIIPEEDKKFFKDLSDAIIKADKCNIPNYKKLGKWVHNYLKYDIKQKGKTFMAKQIYNNKSGVCDHFTLLYNTLLISQGIDCISIVGLSLDITENNILKENEYTKQIQDEPNTLNKYKHAWTLAKIEREWVPLDATLNILDKKVPITHIFQNYGKDFFNTSFTSVISGNQVNIKYTKDIFKYIND